MKKLIALLASVLLIALISGCGAKSFSADKLTVSEYNDAEMNAEVALYIKQKTVTDETEEAALELINSTDRDFSYDAAQRLEVRLSDGKWYVVDDKQDFIIMSIYTLPANGTAEDMFHFDGHYDKLPAGSYRMVKTLTDADGNTALAAAEFDIR